MLINIKFTLIKIFLKILKHNELIEIKHNIYLCKDYTYLSVGICNMCVRS